VPISISAHGDQVDVLARRFREAAASGLRRELGQAVGQAMGSLARDVRASAISRLPHRGGLGALVARSTITQSSFSTAGSVGVRLTASSRHDIAAMDRGSVHHPLFGDRRHWYQQTVPPGWFSEPARNTEPRARVAIENAMDTVAGEIKR
jgi:hypothetical protein